MSLIICHPSPLHAELIISGSRDFKDKVTSNLAEAKSCSPYIATLIENIEKSDMTITITPITDDPLTWHKSGKRTRSHTEALDEKSRSAARNKGTDSIIYINTDRITRTDKTYKRGVLIHELVHAYDLSDGKYHRSYPIREKRAVFFQNICLQQAIDRSPRLLRHVLNPACSIS
ncbi:hypothetical protein DESC_590149 [Desulfosarcina cetonica]|uniref:M91 family zinc metallopeptidase n=1 Tax=Desulfosarcina cetonica TaxID=90730 RepID=UPI0009F9E977|nr:M91 family zinc metallopeptidase [Desulfosarcina cetonica]VTR67234.1 hypothetical protein DESC_590149 [Desulfosarcina cetonica]